MGQYNSPKAKAGKELSVKVIPDGLPIADATTAQLVGKGNLCRIKGTAGGFIKFGDINVEVPSVSTRNTMETEAGYFIVAAPADYIRTSVAMRIEVIKD